RMRGYFGKDALMKNAAVKSDEVTVAWALETSETGAAPKVVSDDGKWNLPMTRVGNSNLYGVVAWLHNGTAMRWHFEVGSRKLGGGQLEVYLTHSDSLEQPNVPKGVVKQQPKWESKVFNSTSRDWWIYIPAQYKPENPACVMVFQ